MSEQLVLGLSFMSRYIPGVLRLDAALHPGECDIRRTRSRWYEKPFGVCEFLEVGKCFGSWREGCVEPQHSRANDTVCDSVCDQHFQGRQSELIRLDDVHSFHAGGDVLVLQNVSA